VESLAAKPGLGPTRRLALIAISMLAALLAAYSVVILAALGGGATQDLFGRWVYDAVVLGASLAVIARSLVLPDERGAWRALGLALLLWALGQAYYSVFLYYASPAPFPSPADAGFLAFYPASFLGIVLLLRARVAHLDPLAWVDGVIGALAIAALAAALIFPPVLEALGGSAFGVAVSLAYPCADLVLLGLVVAALALSNWRGQRTWLPIAAALLLFAAADVVYLSVGGQSTAALNLASIGWPLAFLLLGMAAWVPASSGAVRISRPGRRRIAIPIALAAVVIGLLALGNFTAIGAVAVGLGIACLLTVLVRLGVTFAQNAEMLEASRRDAVTDPLTTLGNRRRLIADLELMLASPPAGGGILALFDLDGFKAYNDGFGHPAGDDLLRRLGARLAAAVAPAGRAYRLGGDEFCILVPAGSPGGPICLAAQRALSERGQGFEITASWGEVALPREAETATSALRMADRRMYGQKGRRADSARSQTRGVLLRVLHEREPRLDRHLEGVAHLAAIAGRALDLEAEELDVLVRAAELHDIGKVAIPDEVLQKRGPLSEVEWALMRKHTLIGERVLSAAPAMSQVAKLVRSTHERWDGSGYPDGLRGEAIPLGSRLILICDAYNAMTEKRAYREAMDDEQARELLRQGAGTQFDPSLVEIFLASLAPIEVAR
jgi:two-component system, cell cycle response regulator